MGLTFQLTILRLCLASLPRKRGGTDIQIGLGKAQGEEEKPTTLAREEFLSKMSNPLLKGEKLRRHGAFFVEKQVRKFVQDLLKTIYG